MRIDPSGTYSPVSSSPVGTNTSATSGRTSETASSTVEDSTFTRTDGLKRLLQTVREVPEVRTEVVADIAQRLALGEFNSTAAATDTAQSFLEQESQGKQ